MKEEVLVSVVIPAYNQDAYLATAIESVLHQTHQYFEIIVVDDGSTDNTPLVVDRFSEHVRYLRQENQGLAGARNTGIRNAVSKLICLLDADDEWLPRYLERMVQMFVEDPGAAVYYCCAQAMDKDGKKLPQVLGCNLHATDQLLDVIIRANFLIPSTVMMNYETIKSGDYFDVDFRRLQDKEMWIRLLKQGYYFRGLTEILVKYRIHDESLSVDVASSRQALMAIAVKHFGMEDQDPQLWSRQKRLAYGAIYRHQALAAFRRQNDLQEGALYFGKALENDPTLADDLDCFYQLALGSQPRGYRGSNEKIDPEGTASKIMSLLDETFQAQSPRLQSLRRRVYGMACYAIGLCAFNTGYFALSRRYLTLAGKYRLEMWLSYDLASRWIKTWLGNQWLAKLRRLSPREALKKQNNP
jgi:glycosyltransferase involved in cell wall biosynthesis